jgi:hypothetical protein
MDEMRALHLDIARRYTWCATSNGAFLDTLVDYN